MRRVTTVISTALVAALFFVGYEVLRAKMVQDIYRERLVELAREYESLRGRYNDVVRQTAITELDVHDGKLDVVIVSADGELKRIPTPYDPSEEIHVDYVIRDGRLWIRRIHDSKTPADQALVIDPKLVDIEWDEPGKNYGITIYRSLGEGRWVVSATQNGALALTRKPEGEETELSPPPSIREFDELEKTLGDDIDAVGFGDVVDKAWRSSR